MSGIADLPEFTIGAKRYKFNEDNGHIYKLNESTGSWDKTSQTAGSLSEAKSAMKVASAGDGEESVG